MTARDLPRFRASLLAAAERFGHSVARGDREWYRIENKGEKAATVYLYDEIGFWGDSASDFARAVAGLDVATIDLRLNSPGGYVFDGVAIYNTLVNHPATVNVAVDGVAASIASVIAMAGDTVTMGRGTRMMIHNPSGGVMGQARDMREMADLLDELGKDIAGFYSARAGGSVDQWLTSMDTEVWYSAQEAVDAGLADSVLGAEPAPVDAAPKTFDLTAYGFKFAGREQAPDPAALARSIRSAQLRARHEARRQEARGK